MSYRHHARAIRALCFTLVSTLAWPASATPEPASTPVVGQRMAAPLPTAARDAVTRDAFEDILEPLTEDRLFKTARVGVHVVNVRTGDQVFARNADASMTPASTMKIITAATALKTLGPSYRFSTDVYTDASVKPDENGTLKGHLYVQGHGDPTFVVETLWKLVLDLKLQGLSRVEGDVVFDEGFFSTDYPIPGWSKPNDVENGPSYFPPLGALR